ncbi:hypothetical protein BVX98_02985, partial [bacterium F11]
YPNTTTNQIRTQLVFSGETAEPGLAPYGQIRGGKTGSPDPQYAGIGATVTIRLVDQYYNLITAGAPMPTVEVTNTDAKSDAPGYGFANPQVSLVNGVAEATVTFVTQNNPNSLYGGRDGLGWRVELSEVSVLGYTMDKSTWVVSWPNDAIKLRVMASNQDPVEGDDPNGSGKTNSGSPIDATVGVAYPVTVQAVDQYWNWNKGLGPLHNAGIGQQVDIETNDTYAINHNPLPLVQGQRAFTTFQPRTAQGAMFVRAVDDDGPVDLSSQTITGINVVANSPVRYLMLMPGETHVPGSTLGKIGSPNSPVAGNAIGAPGVEVILVDMYWNEASTTTQPYVELSAPEAIDVYAVMPSSAQMVSEHAQFISTVVFRTAGVLSHRLVASDPDGVYTSTSSMFFTVDPNNLTRLQVLMPGETADPGRPVNYGGAGEPAGKSGE